MIDKTKIIEYIDMLVLNRKKEKPYYDLCGGEMLLYDIIWDTEVFAGKALGIPEDTITQFIMDYAWNGYIILDGKLLMTSEEIADCIIKDSAIKSRFFVGLVPRGRETNIATSCNIFCKLI